MRGAVATLLLLAAPAAALNEGLQCVPYARALSGVTIFGDAHTWWGQANNRFARGQQPKVGAVLAFQPHGNMRLGHVAAVRKVIDDRTILISHANWSTIGGKRGHIEQDVRAVDVSPAGDWSAVRVWYTPNAAMGSTRWPAHGFIYPKSRRSDGEVKAALTQLLRGRAAAPVSVAVTVPIRPAPQTGFALATNVLNDIDRKAVKEAKAVASPAKHKPIDAIMAKLKL